jgi:hypothetical protein
MTRKRLIGELSPMIWLRAFFLCVKRKFKLLLEKLTLADTVRKRRRKIASRLDKIFHSTVAYGPFRGLKLTENPWWSFADRAPAFLGLYEREVLTALQNVPPTYRTFVDLGAADGYYGVGVLINNMFDRSYCFEISEEGQKAIRQNAALNRVSDRIVVMGIADKGFYKQLSPDELGQAVVLIDIEGAEFDLMDSTVFKALKDSIVIIEIHDWFFSDGAAKLQSLKNAAAATHALTPMTMESRDLSKFEELKNFHDTDRWLICSEGRKRLMTWLRLDPLRS